MAARPRLFVKKRGTRRTGTRWAGKVAEGILFATLLGLGIYGLYRLIDYIRSTEGAGWWPWFAMVIPAALIVFGAFELIALLWKSSVSTERRAAAVRKATDWELPGTDSRPGRPTLPTVPSIDTVVDSPGVRLAYRLPIDAAPGWASFTMAAVCFTWNAFVLVFVVQIIALHRAGQADWRLTALMMPFVLAGLWTFVVLARQVLAGVAIGATRLEVSQHPFYPGSTFQGFLSQSGRLSVRWLQVLLVCEEQAIYQQGTDTRRANNRVFRATLFSQRKFEIRPREAFEITFDATLPTAAMHSFVSTHNSISWALVVRGRMSRWGDFERRFPVFVYPQPAAPTNQPLLASAGARAR